MNTVELRRPNLARAERSACRFPVAGSGFELREEGLHEVDPLLEVDQAGDPQREGRQLDAEDLVFGGQDFHGSVEFNRIEGVFEIGS